MGIHSPFSGQAFFFLGYGLLHSRTCHHLRVNPKKQISRNFFKFLVAKFIRHLGQKVSMFGSSLAWFFSATSDTGKPWCFSPVFFAMKYIPDTPWCWYIYLQNWVILGVNVGKYSSTMEYLGMGENPLDVPDQSDGILWGPLGLGASSHVGHTTWW